MHVVLLSENVRTDAAIGGASYRLATEKTLAPLSRLAQTLTYIYHLRRLLFLLRHIFINFGSWSAEAIQ